MNTVNQTQCVIRLIPTHKEPKKNNGMNNENFAESHQFGCRKVFQVFRKVPLFPRVLHTHTWFSVAKETPQSNKWNNNGIPSIQPRSTEDIACVYTENNARRNKWKRFRTNVRIYDCLLWRLVDWFICVLISSLHRRSDAEAVYLIFQVGMLKRNICKHLKSHSARCGTWNAVPPMSSVWLLCGFIVKRKKCRAEKCSASKADDTFCMASKVLGKEMQHKKPRKYKNTQHIALHNLLLTIQHQVVRHPLCASFRMQLNCVCTLHHKLNVLLFTP